MSIKLAIIEDSERLIELLEELAKILKDHPTDEMERLKKERNEYWNPIMETLPLEKLRDLQVKKFKKIMEWAYERSKFHRKLYQEAGLEPGDIKSYEDVANGQWTKQLTLKGSIVTGRRLPVRE